MGSKKDKGAYNVEVQLLVLYLVSLDIFGYEAFI
jgi:hypothetical protein